MEGCPMARITPRPHPTTTQTLYPILRYCLLCGNTMWAAYHNYRTITTLTDVLRLTLQIRRCITPACPQFQQPYRPEEEGRYGCWNWGHAGVIQRRIWSVRRKTSVSVVMVR